MTRFVNLFAAEAMRAVQEGICSIRDVDEMVKAGLGWPMGVFELLDKTASFDAWYHAQEYLHETLGRALRDPSCRAQGIHVRLPRGAHPEAGEPRRLVRLLRHRSQVRQQMKREVVVVAGCRTAQGTFGGTLRDVPAHGRRRSPLQQVVVRRPGRSRGGHRQRDRRPGLPDLAGAQHRALLRRRRPASHSPSPAPRRTQRAVRRSKRSTAPCVRSRKATRTSLSLPGPRA